MYDTLRTADNVSIIETFSKGPKRIEETDIDLYHLTRKQKKIVYMNIVYPKLDRGHCLKLMSIISCIRQTYHKTITE